MPDLVAPPGYVATDSGLLLPTDLRASHFGDVTNSQTPSPWLVDWFNGGRRVHSGQAVSPQSSMALAAYYACLNVIAQDCAKLPFPVLRELERGREKVRNHPLWRVLQRVFNPDMTAYIGRYVMTHHAVGWGNGYGLILRDRSMGRREGQVTGIYPIHPARVHPERDRDTGDIVYRVYQGGRLGAEEIPERIAASDMIHLKGPTGDGLVGYSIAQLAAENLGLSLAAQQYGAEFFGESGIPSGVLTHPGHFKDAKAIQEFRERWDSRRNGTAVLEDGVKFETLTIPPDDAQFILTRQHGDLDISRWFRMQPHKISILDNAHHTNIEQQNIEHVTDTMLPWFVMWEQEICMKLLQDEPALYVRHDARALLRGDSAARAEYFKSMFMIAAYSPNDILEAEDMNPYDGGDERFLQIQYAPVRKIVDGTARQPRQAGRPLSPQDTSALQNGHTNGAHAYVG